jgi:CRP-like cAMP-binding protein
MWSGLIEPHISTSFGTTTQETRLISIDAHKLRDLCERDPQVGYRLAIQIAKLLAHRLEGARVQLATV